MQIQATDNSNVGFKGNKTVRAAILVNASDNQLKNIAYDYSYDKENEKKHQKSISRTFMAIPVVDSIAHGILNAPAQSSLSRRIAESGKAAKGWGSVILAFGVFNFIKNKITANNKTLKEFEYNNPVLSLIADVGLVCATLFAGQKAVTKLLEKNPKILETVGEKIVKACKSIDKSKMNKKVLPKIEKAIEKFSTKAPWAATAGKFALANSMFLLLGAAVYKTIKHTKKNNDKIEANYNMLKKEQLQAAKYLAKTTVTDRDVIAQEQKKMIAELEKALD